MTTDDEIKKLWLNFQFEEFEKADAEDALENKHLERAAIRLVRHFEKEWQEQSKPSRSEEFLEVLQKAAAQANTDYSFYCGLNGDVRKVARAEGEGYAYRNIKEKYLATHTEPIPNPPSVFDVEHTKHKWVHDREKNEDICSKCGVTKEVESHD